MINNPNGELMRTTKLIPAIDFQTFAHCLHTAAWQPFFFLSHPQMLEEDGRHGVTGWVSGWLGGRGAQSVPNTPQRPTSSHTLNSVRYPGHQLTHSQQPAALTMSVCAAGSVCIYTAG